MQFTFGLFTVVLAVVGIVSANPITAPASSLEKRQCQGEFEVCGVGLANGEVIDPCCAGLICEDDFFDLGGVSFSLLLTPPSLLVHCANHLTSGLRVACLKG